MTPGGSALLELSLGYIMECKLHCDMADIDTSLMTDFQRLFDPSRPCFTQSLLGQL